MDTNKNYANEVCMVDSSKSLTKEGITNVCSKYGSVKNVILKKKMNENRAFIEFEKESSVHQLLSEKLDLPSFLHVELSTRSTNLNLFVDKDNHEDVVNDNCGGNSNIVITNKEDLNDIEKTSETGLQSIYFGTHVSGSTLIEKSKELKLSKIQFYNLNNDHLFGRPINTKWDQTEELQFNLNNLDFYQRFENCTGGQVKIEKMLSPNSFSGWPTFFNNNENIQNTLYTISEEIECSEFLNIESLKAGMLVGALDNAINLFGRGYVTLVAGNSVNVAMCDYGKIINTIDIRKLPEKYNQLPAFAFKIYTKENWVLQQKEDPFDFKIRSVSSERIVLIIFDANKEIKVQLKKWNPSIEEYGVPYINFRNGSSVELLKLKDMNSVYLRSKEKEHFEIFFSSWNSIAAYCYKNPQPLNRVPFFGEIVGFKSLHSNNYVRGRIHKYFGFEIYSVKHMDNPYKENIKMSEMIELPFEYKSMPVSYLKVGLKNALQYPIQCLADQFIKHVIGVKLIVQYDQSKIEGWKNVDLTIKVAKENLNSILFGLVEPSWLNETPKDDELGVDFCSPENLLQDELEVNSVLNMTFVMYFDGIFYMRDKWFGKSFSVLSNMIKEYCSLSLNPYLPHNDEVCLGQFPDGLWYRVMCDQLRPGELVKVHSIDLGNVAFLHPRNMKKLPVDLWLYPSHVYLCILDSFEKIDVSKLDQLQKYENTDVEFTVVNKCSNIKNHYLINCPFLEGILSMNK